MNFLGDIGGVFDLLQQWAKIILAPYLAYYSKFVSYGMLYSHRYHKDHDTDQKKKAEKARYNPIEITWW